MAKTEMNITSVGIIVGWVITILVLVWQVAVKDSQYSLEIENIKNELISVDKRLNTTEAFKLEISSDLAEIKTDLLWIRQQLQENSKVISEIALQREN
tara:strand:- start:651 stop:944 length:294 start_codon:yes stop_codon:yes gene_type:complete